MKIVLFFLLALLTQLTWLRAQQVSASMPKSDKTLLFSGGKKIFEDKFTFGADKLWILPNKKEQGFSKIEQGVLKVACALSEGVSAYIKIPIEKVKAASVSFLMNNENCDFMAFALRSSEKDEPFIMRINNIGAVTLSRVSLEASNKEERLPNTKAETIEKFDVKKWYRVRVDMTKDEIAVIINGKVIQQAKSFGGLTLNYDMLRFSANSGKIQLDEVEIEVKS
jgi:hypothetical protein